MPDSSINSSSLNQPNNAIGTLPGSTTGSTSGGGTTTGTTTGGQGTGFESCDLADRYHTITIGHFGICQSTQDETLFKLRTSLGSPTERVCLIPTYKDATGSSTYIGQPQCTYTEAGKVIQGKLFKNRTGFESYALNGVIVMKEALLPQYFNCMNAYLNWPAPLCPQGPQTSQYCYGWIQACPYGARTNANCDAEAKRYMTQTCTSFKSTYSNSYADIRTK